MNIVIMFVNKPVIQMEKNKKELKEIIDYYYNPNVECTCEAIFGDTHRITCKRRKRPNK